MRERFRTIIRQWLSDENHSQRGMGGYSDHQHQDDLSDVIIDGHYNIEALLDKLTEIVEHGS